VPPRTEFINPIPVILPPFIGVAKLVPAPAAPPVTILAIVIAGAGVVVV
jgi:hypothetical protein